MFFHILNDQIQSVYGLPQKLGNRLIHECRLSLRLALLAQEQLEIPTVDLIQSFAASQLREDLLSLAELGLVTFVGSTANLDELIERKRTDYEGTGLHVEWSDSQTHRDLEALAPFFQRRSVNTTREMKALWLNAAENGDGTGLFLVQSMRRIIVNVPRRERMRRRILAVPTDLEGHAFLTSVLRSLRIIPELAKDRRLAEDVDMALANA